MSLSDQRWKRIAESAFPWEREALEYIRTSLPDTDPYCGWTNFEFLADDGTVNEVDALVLTPRGIFLVEIKSDDGVLTGDRGTWTFDKPNGRKKTIDNPIFGADRKCKKLKSLLTRQQVFRKEPQPYIEPLVFLSNPALDCKLPEPDRARICTHRPEHRSPDIIAALKFRDGPGLDPADDRNRVDRPVMRRIAIALEQAGIRPSQRLRRVGDYRLKELLGEGPESNWQDWDAEHVALPKDIRRVRIYMVARQTDPRAVQLMANREYEILRGLRHPGILEADSYTTHDLGPAIFFRREPGEVRFDFWLKERGASLTIDVRLELIRQIAEALRYAHSRRIVHRALSPQSILVTQPEVAVPQLRIFNWQAGRELDATHTSRTTSSVTVHLQQFLEDSSAVYLAPETLKDLHARGETMDVFSLGAIAFHILTGERPAPTPVALLEILKQHRGLPLRAILDAPPADGLQNLIASATHPEVLNRIPTAAEFLARLEQVEDELTRPDSETTVANPLEAKKGDRLPYGLTVESRIGTGGSARAFLVNKDSQQLVLKLALKPENNDRIRAELESLRKLNHPRIVKLHSDLLDIDGLAAFLMDRAGTTTLADRLREDGRISSEFLDRFGDDLLNVLQYLEDQGVPHRDLKPENIGVDADRSTRELHLKLFDFSLSKAPLDQIFAGTPSYIEPFLVARRRWDPHAERFSASLVLYEMATGTLPKWGDGQSDPHQLDCEATIESNLMDAAVREPLTRFFTQALRRDPAQRFDTAFEMRAAWHQVFHEARITESAALDAPAREQAIQTATLDTPILLLHMSTRAQNVLERENVSTVRDLLATPSMRFRHLRGVGDKTRKEIVEVQRDLRLRFPENVIPEKAELAAEVADVPVVNSIDEIVAQLLPAENAKSKAERRIMAAILDLDSPEDQAPLWRNQNEIAQRDGVTRARIWQVMKTARGRWVRNPSLTEVRNDIAAALESANGVIEVGELAEALLAKRGSAAEGSVRVRRASAVSRAALEAERDREKPRYIERRSGSAILIVHPDTAEMAAYAARLGEEAHRLAHADPLPAPARVLETLRGVEVPLSIAQPPAETRIVRLAAAIAGVAVSPRLELYPKGMAAAQAIQLSRSALVGAAQLTEDDIRARVRDRYPEAQSLPSRTALDELLRATGIDLEWDPGVRLYSAPAPPPEYSSSVSLHRLPTAYASLPPDLPPTEAAARERASRAERALQSSLQSAGFLVLATDPHLALDVEDAIARRFPVEVLDCDALLIAGMRDRAAKFWDRVIAADADPSNELDWTRLKKVVTGVIPEFESRIRAAGRPVLLTNPGLLARYDQLSVLDRLRDDPSRGIWLLAPGSDTQKPMIDGRAIPVFSESQWTRLDEAWVKNLHRGAVPA